MYASGLSVTEQCERDGKKYRWGFAAPFGKENHRFQHFSQQHFRQERRAEGVDKPIASFLWSPDGKIAALRNLDHKGCLAVI